MNGKLHILCSDRTPTMDVKSIQKVKNTLYSLLIVRVIYETYLMPGRILDKHGMCAVSIKRHILLNLEQFGVKTQLN